MSKRCSFHNVLQLEQLNNNFKKECYKISLLFGGYLNEIESGQTDCDLLLDILWDEFCSFEQLRSDFSVFEECIVSERDMNDEHD